MLIPKVSDLPRATMDPLDRAVELFRVVRHEADTNGIFEWEGARDATFVGWYVVLPDGTPDRPSREEAPAPGLLINVNGHSRVPLYEERTTALARARALAAPIAAAITAAVEEERRACLECAVLSEADDARLVEDGYGEKRDPDARAIRSTLELVQRLIDARW